MSDIPTIDVTAEGTVLIDGIPFDPAVHQIGWEVLDPDGNRVDCGPIVIAEMAGETVELLNALEDN